MARRKMTMAKIEAATKLLEDRIVADYRKNNPYMSASYDTIVHNARYFDAREEFEIHDRWVREQMRNVMRQKGN